MTTSVSEKSRIAVLGAGSWGTALAMLLARNQHPTLLWARNSEHAKEMAAERCNQRYLPGADFPEALAIANSLEDAVKQADGVLVACPSHAFVELLTKILPMRPANQPLFWATKGFEPGSGRFLHEVVEELLPGEQAIGAVTGPSFAAEVAQGLPTAVTVASRDAESASWFASLLHGGHFRAYTSDDLKGAEVGGAVKNVLAVATGIADGMGLGLNTRAALITRGLSESLRLGKALGAKQETFMGLTGIGDLVLTCTGDLSRNRRYGLALGRGVPSDEAVREIGQVVEGIGTSKEVHRLAQKHGVEMPISEQTYKIIHEGKAPADGLRDLLSRQQRPEF